MFFRGILLAAFLVTARGDGRIAGGDVTDITNFPFAAALLTNGGSGEFLQKCGGSIVSNRAILSAASCFHTDGTPDAVTLWRARVGSTSSLTSGFIHFINRITIHYGFNSITYVNDLAVLRPSVAFAWRDTVQPAPIAGAVFTVSDRQPIWAVGWGKTSTHDTTNSAELRVVQFFVIDQAICAERYSSLSFAVTENMVCAGWLDVGNRAQCEGDNGSPLLIDGVVVGVKSRSEACPDPYYPSINTRVAPYSRWIVEAAVAP